MKPSETHQLVNGITRIIDHRNGLRGERDKLSEALGIAKLTLVTMLDHEDPKVRELAQAALDGIRDRLTTATPKVPE